MAISYLGPLGVNVFFVISGFLITTLCIKEKVATGNLSLRNFYVRRVFRILPVAYLYILVVIILNFVFKLQLTVYNVVIAVFFLSDISVIRFKFDWNLAHFWSLSVEEQFYIFFPVLIKKKFKLFVFFVLTLPFLVPFMFYLQSVIPSLNIALLSSMLRFLNKFQAIAIGCLFSVLMFKGYFKFGKLNFVITLASIFMIFHLKFDAFVSLRSSFVNLIISIFTGFIIVNNVQYKNNPIFKILNFKPLGFIGILSYSIYIWQQLFLSNDPRMPLSRYPINLLLLIIVPCLSYFLFEKYFLTLKNRFSKTVINKNG